MGDVPSSRIVLYFVTTNNAIAIIYEIHNYFIKFLCEFHKDHFFKGYKREKTNYDRKNHFPGSGSLAKNAADL